MLFKDAVMKVNKEEVKESFVKLYPTYAHNVDKYLSVLDKLKAMEPAAEAGNLIVAVDWYEPDTGWEEIEDETEGSYRVHGFEPEKETFWAIEYSHWNNWLAWQADERYILLHNIADYIAHCLWEITWAGFEEDDIEKSVNLIFDRTEEE